MTNNTPQEILAAIEKAKSIVLALHTSPDGDCTASCIAMSLVLSAMGKEVTVLSADEAPTFLENILDLSIIKIVDPGEYDYENTDLVILMDTSSLSLITYQKDFELPQHLTVINIDHHPNNKNQEIANLNLVFENSSSNCEILFGMFKDLKIEYGLDVATALVVGITTDTGYFTQANTTFETFCAVGELGKKGVKYFDISWELNFNQELDQMKYIGRIYENLKTDFNRGIAYSSFAIKEYEELGIDPDISQRKGSDLIKSLKGIKYAFFVKEKMEEGEIVYTISLRTHEKGFDVSLLARELGGGGHKQASAALVTNVKSIEEAIKHVIEASDKVYA